MIDPILAQPGPYGHLQGASLRATRRLCREVLHYVLWRDVQESVLQHFPTAAYVEIELDEEEDVGPRFVRVHDRQHSTLGSLGYDDYWENTNADVPITHVFGAVNDLRSELYQKYDTSFTLHLLAWRPEGMSSEAAAQVLGLLGNAPIWR